MQDLMSMVNRPVFVLGGFTVTVWMLILVAVILVVAYKMKQK